MAPRGSSSAPSSPLQLRVTLQGVTPPVWRRIVVPGGLTLSGLHAVLQVAMGWEDAHLHRFEVDEVGFGPLDDEDDSEDEDETTVTVGEVLASATHAQCEYDLGDEWLHEIEVEERLTVPSRSAVCIDGQGRCPPENGGGVTGYAAMLEVLADPNHEEHAAVGEWVGTSFDPEGFDLAAVNAALERLV